MVLEEELRAVHLDLQAAEGEGDTLARLELLRPQSPFLVSRLLFSQDHTP